MSADSGNRCFAVIGAGHGGKAMPGDLAEARILRLKSLVPMADLGRHFGVRTPVMDSLITLASTLHGKGYWVSGRTMERLGLEGWSVEQISHYVNGGDD